MMEDILEQNEANKMTPAMKGIDFRKPTKAEIKKGITPEQYQPKSGVNVDIDSTVGNRTFKKGEMRDYMRAVADVERALRMSEGDPSKMAEAQKIVEPYFGPNNDMKGPQKGGKSRIAQQTRNLLSRIGVARQLQKLYDSGDLQKVMSQSMMQGQKVSFDQERPGFPFLKLGADSDLDPESFGLRGENLEWTLDLNLIF